MRIGIKTKLVLAFLLSNALLASLMFAIITWRLDRGFVNYITDVEEQRMQPVLEDLAEFYGANQSFEPMRNNFRAWDEIILSNLGRPQHRNGPPGSQAGQPPAPGLGQPPPRIRAANSDRPPPPPARANLFRHGLLLANSDRDILIGPPMEPAANTRWVNIEYQGTTVGYLVLVPTELMQGSLDQVFVEEQTNAFAWIAAGSLLFAVLIGLLLASIGLRPISKLHTGMKSLAAGDYKQRLNIGGNDELMDLSQQFNQLAKILEENKDAQDQWLADISHELRTPVSVLRGEIEAVVDGVRPLNSERIHSLHEEILHLQGLIKELHELSLSDLGAMKYEKTDLDFAEFFDHQVAQFRNLAEEADLRLLYQEKSDSVTMFADELKLRQLFLNLFQNTTHYTDKPGTLEIDWRVAAKELVITWSDSAPKVSDAEKDKLFDRLYRGDNSRNRSTGGSGLGLAIVRNIVDAHEGSVAVDDSELGGLRFTIRLPIR